MLDDTRRTDCPRRNDSRSPAQLRAADINLICARHAAEANRLTLIADHRLERWITRQLHEQL